MENILDVLLRVGEISFAAGATIAYMRYRLDRLDRVTARLEARLRKHARMLRLIRRRISSPNNADGLAGLPHEDGVAHGEFYGLPDPAGTISPKELGEDERVGGV